MEPIRNQVAVVLRARVLTSLVDAATVFLTVRLATKDEFGILQLLLMVYEVGRFVVTLGFPDSVYYFFAKLPESQRRALALRTLQLLALGGLGLGAVLVGASAIVPSLLPRWSPEAQAQVAASLKPLGLVAAIELPTWGLYPLLVASGHGRTAGAFEVITSLGGLAALLLPLAMGQGIPGVLLGLLIYAVGRLVLMLVLLLPRLPAPGSALGPGFLREQAGYAIPLGLNTVLGRLNKYTDKLIVGALLAESMLAEYGVASTEVPFITVFPYAIGSVLVPHYVRALNSATPLRALTLWRTAARRVALVVIPTGVFAIFAAQDLVVCFAGEAYRKAAVPFALVASILLWRVAQYGGMMQALNDNRAMLKITIGVVVINGLLSLPLTLVWGVAGTAAGTVLAQVIGLVATIRRISHGLQQPPGQILPWRHMGQVLLVALGAACIALALRHWLVPTDAVGKGALVAVAAYLGLYLTAGTVAGVIDRPAWHSLGLLLGRSR